MSNLVNYVLYLPFTGTFVRQLVFRYRPCGLSYSCTRPSGKQVIVAFIETDEIIQPFSFYSKLNLSLFALCAITTEGWVIALT